MTFQSLQYFLTVYEEGSITMAAKRLFISQQSLSIHIKQLEEECEAELFIRRPVFRPTYAGDRLAAAARDILRLKKQTLSEIRNIETGQTGKMTVGFSGILAQEHLPEILKFFYEKYPGIKVTAITSDSASMEEMALSGQLDFYIGTSVSSKSEMVVTPLIEFSLIAAVRESLFRRCTGFSSGQTEQFLKEGITLKDLQKVPVILPLKGWRVRKPIDQYIKTHQLSMNIILETSQGISVSSCQKGIGAGILYSITHIDAPGTEDRILRFPLKNIGYTVHSCVCHRSDHFLSGHEEMFIRLTRTYFENPDQEPYIF